MQRRRLLASIAAGFTGLLGLKATADVVESEKPKKPEFYMKVRSKDGSFTRDNLVVVEINWAEIRKLGCDSEGFTEYSITPRKD